MYTPAHWLKEHYGFVWWLTCVLSLSPGADLGYRYYTEDLGINPLETLMQTTGLWATTFLVITLSITPLRRSLSSLSRYLHARYGKRLSDWNWIIRLRRMLGIYSFLYALAHGLTYLVFDAALNMTWVIQDIQEKPYIVYGMSAFLLLVPLFLTSTDNMMRYLGRNWRRLHRLIYVIILLTLLHFWGQNKLGVVEPLPYTIFVFVLLGYRLLACYGMLVRKPKDDGMEVPERS